MHNPLKNSLIVIIFCIVLASIDPLDWHSYLLHQIGTVFLMLPMAYLFIKHKISTKSLYAMTAFLLLHILGAKYLYSYVPYDQWSTVLFGIGINDIFGFKRNHYDRLVHFAYGVCLYPLIYDLIKHWFKTSSQNSLCLLCWRSIWQPVCFMNFLNGVWRLAYRPSKQNNTMDNKAICGTPIKIWRWHSLGR